MERPQVTAAVSAAAAQGDRSENAEYTYGKRRLREIDSRVRHLRKRLDGMVVVEQPPADPRRVFFGAWVDLEDEDGSEVRYRIVGPDEFDMAEGYISMDAPLARALLGKRLDEEIAVSIAGQRRPATSSPRSTTAEPAAPPQTTRTFLNCHGSVRSRSSGNRLSRSDSGDQSV